MPGLTNQAQPAFPDVDRYETHEFVFTMKHNAVLPKSEKCDALGRTPQKRNYFWYERTFTAPARSGTPPCWSSTRRSSARLFGSTARTSANIWVVLPPAGSTSTAAMNWSGRIAS